MRSIREILEAGSMAVIGASRDPQKPGAQLIHVLQKVGYKGNVAGVNPQGGEVFGAPLFRSLEEVPFPVDLAVLHIPPKLVPAALNDCVRKGVKGAVISSEGFAETGPRGLQFKKKSKKSSVLQACAGLGPTLWGL